MKLTGKKAIVTGANRNIGRAIALAFAKEGAEVLISYRSDQSGAKKTLSEMKSGKAFFGDFSTTQGVEKFFKEAIDNLGSIDILVNNAADYNTNEFLDLPVEEFEKLLKISVVAPMLLTQLAAKKMIQDHKEGKIINISSICGERPSKGHFAHSTGKAALNMITKNSALELAPYKIQVNAIAPGTTPYEKEGEERVGTPEDQAEAALFLASNNTWMTGQILVVDGGESLPLYR